MGGWSWVVEEEKTRIMLRLAQLKLKLQAGAQLGNRYLGISFY